MINHTEGTQILLKAILQSCYAKMSAMVKDSSPRIHFLLQNQNPKNCDGRIHLYIHAHPCPRTKDNCEQLKYSEVSLLIEL